ncbi:outer membrane beta-barrel protein [Plebeiibacterium marinum]|uniref:PorT family protein n=1 Tax=Plebeiibacterium marinum TaxID=2992111 RepID=A0AAE3MBE8_9BACT|nr:outer membrane beta-barrel protein [Plebeiobacterium marinum]MCW3804387.1 PorT family protein [Plebeiobacterium marinum]
MKTIYKNITVLSALLLMSLSVTSQIRIQPSIGFGSNKISYDSDYATVDGLSGLNLGVDAFYYLNEDMAVGLGLRLSQYGASAKVDDFEISEQRIDGDNDSYLYTAIANGIEEEHKLSVVEIPILFKYQRWVSADILLTGTTGPVFMMTGSMKSEFTSGTLTTSGYYEQWNLTIDDLAEYGFYPGLNMKGDAPDLDVKSTLAWSFELGAEYYLNKRMNVFLSAYFQPAFGNISGSDVSTDIMPEPGVFNGTIMGADNIKLSKAGIKLGLVFDLTPPEKAGVKSIR